MTISIELNAEDTHFVERWAASKNMSAPDLLRQMLLERIEDEMDLRAYEEARAEYEADPVSYTLDEVEKELLRDGV